MATHTPPPLRGPPEVALASFGTAGGVSLLVTLAGLWLGMDPLLITITLVCALGAGLGYFLWGRGHLATATALGSAGFLLAGATAHLLLGTVSGSAGILYLASVITAGGLYGTAAAGADVALAAALIGLCHSLGPVARDVLGVPAAGLPVDERAFLAFVLASLPCWGLYVVALDASNRKARARAEEGFARQSAVARLGLAAASSEPFSDLQSQAIRQLERHLPNCQARLDLAVGAAAEGETRIPILVGTQEQSLVLQLPNGQALSTEDEDFFRSTAQVLGTRRLRDLVWEERAKLADRKQQKERLESLARMAGGVAHDFNNALMVILGGATALSRDAEGDPKKRERLESILQASKVAANLTEKLLTFSQGLPLAKEVFSPADVIVQLQPLPEHSLEEDQDLVLDLQETSLSLHLPRVHFQQVLLNLAKNATDAMNGAGALTIRLECSLLPGEDRPGLLLTVRDTGRGMSQATLGRAVEPFFTGGEDNANGAGLGLAIVHGIVKQAGGELEIQSEVGEGTEVRVTLPLYEKDAGAEETSPVADPRSDTENGSRHLLLVDDDPEVRSVVAEMLKHLGWKVAQAENTATALKILSRQSIRVLISDIRLREESGFDLVKTVRAQGYTPKILFITGYAGQGQETTAEGERLLVKPFGAEALAEALRALNKQ